MLGSVAHQRIVKAAAASLTVVLVDQDGEPADAAGTVTVRVQRADGTDLLAAGSATSNPGGTGTYAVALTAASTGSLDLLTATWSDGATVVATTLHEVVGGVYFTVAQARAADSSISQATHPDENVKAARAEVEQQCEQITGVAWVPRFRRCLIERHGGCDIVVPDQQVRVVRSVASVLSTGALEAWSAERVAAIVADPGGVLNVGPGTGWLMVAYEHGYDRPPADLVKASIQHLRHQLNTFTTSSLIDRATQVQTIEGQSMQLATPGRFGFDTGIPTVDAVYQRYDHHIGIG